MGGEKAAGAAGAAAAPGNAPTGARRGGGDAASARAARSRALALAHLPLQVPGVVLAREPLRRRLRGRVGEPTGLLLGAQRVGAAEGARGLNVVPRGRLLARGAPERVVVGQRVVAPAAPQRALRRGHLLAQRGRVRELGVAARVARRLERLRRRAQRGERL